MLKRAEKVEILEVMERADDGSSLASDHTIAAGLARQGIKPAARTSIAVDISVGNEFYRASLTLARISSSWGPMATRACASLCSVVSLATSHDT